MKSLMSSSSRNKLEKFLILLMFSIFMTLAYVGYWFISRYTGADIWFLRKISTNFDFLGQKIEFPSAADRYLLGTIILLTIYYSVYTFLVPGLMEDINARKNQQSPKSFGRFLIDAIKKIPDRKANGGVILLVTFLFTVSVVFFSSLTWALKLKFNTKGQIFSYLALIGIFLAADLLENVGGFLMGQVNFAKRKDSNDGEGNDPNNNKEKKLGTLKALKERTLTKIKDHYPVLLVMAGFMIITCLGKVLLNFLVFEKSTFLNFNLNWSLKVKNFEFSIISNKDGLIVKSVLISIYGFLAMCLAVKVKVWIERKNNNRLQAKKPSSVPPMKKSLSDDHSNSANIKLVSVAKFAGILLISAFLGAMESTMGQINNSMQGSTNQGPWAIIAYTGFVFCALLSSALLYYVKGAYVFSESSDEAPLIQEPKKRSISRSLEFRDSRSNDSEAISGL